MGGWFPRISLDGRHVASGNLDITLDGVLLSPDGIGPVWAQRPDGSNLLYYVRQSDGALMYWEWGGPLSPQAIRTSGGNSIAAGGSRWAIYRTDPVRIIYDNGFELADFRDPAYDDLGENIAYLDQAGGNLYVNGVMKMQAPCMNPRWGSLTLCWECNTRIYGCTTPGQPVVDLTVPGLRQYKPVPVWTGKYLLVLSHTDTGLILQRWGTNSGWLVYNGGVDGPMDARWNPDTQTVRIAYNVKGVLQEAWIDPDEDAEGQGEGDLTVIAAPPSPVPEDVLWETRGGTTPDMMLRVMPDVSAVVNIGGGSYGILWCCKAQSPSIPDRAWGAWLDYTTENIGLLCDSSTGRMLSDGRPNWNCFDGQHLWMPRRAMSGWRTSYVTSLRWADGSARPITVRLGLDVGYARFQGVEVDIRHMYDPRDRDSKNPKRKTGFLEYTYYNAANGSVRWEEWQDDQNGVLQLKRFAQPMPRVASPYVAPPRPTPFPAIVQEQGGPVGITPQQIQDSANRWPWDFDVEYLAKFRDGVWKRDQGGDVPSRGALAYYHRGVIAAFVARCIEVGKPLVSPEDWGPVFQRGVDNALATYKREQGPGPDDPQ